MKRFYFLPLVALAAACSESTAPTSPAVDDLKPMSTWSGASFGFDGSSTAGAGFSLSSQLMSTSPSNETFLGRFTNEQVTLQVPAGASTLKLQFNLYIIGSWDGFGGKRYGSDTWEVAAFCEGSSSAIKTFTTDFSNKVTTKQHFPNDETGVLNPGLSTATADALGYNLSSTKGKGSATDATYKLMFELETVPCSGPVNFVFRSPSQVQSVADESWGLDNIVISGT